MLATSTLAPIAGFRSLPGCHCVTASLRKICDFHGCPISEEMLLGLGAGAGFVYWHQQGQPPFLGGRGNNKNFTADLARRTGIAITERTTGSAAVAERELLRLLRAGEPVMLYADMPYLTYLDLPADAHFGGHAVVACGLDETARQVLISDMAPRQTGYKDGITHPLSLDQLALARGSRFQPFPPGNRWFELDFSAARPPRPEDAAGAVAQCAREMLHPPIQNLGVAGIRTAAKRAARWPEQLDETALRLALFNVYIYTEIGGSGGGLFRLMYSRFLDEAAALTGSAVYDEGARKMLACGQAWRRAAAPLEAALEHPAPRSLVAPLCADLLEIAALEQHAWESLTAA